MAKQITATQLGAQPKVFDDVNTVADLITKLGLDNPSIKVNGQEAKPETVLSDYQFVSFGEKVKGGAQA